ncbi:MAG: hypothetical protein GY758_33445 [Fuerstiella sp.]|nr:hypothetical protein [Fuerstiella sp.]MCP4507383.1 hypothetical protein [Fuerstiella sp.]
MHKFCGLCHNATASLGQLVVAANAGGGVDIWKGAGWLLRFRGSTGVSLPRSIVHRQRHSPVLADWHKGESLMDGQRDGVSLQVFELISISSVADGIG